MAVFVSTDISVCSMKSSQNVSKLIRVFVDIRSFFVLQLEALVCCSAGLHSVRVSRLHFVVQPSNYQVFTEYKRL